MVDVTDGTKSANEGKVSAHTKALREKVAELEAEAKSLGLDSALSEVPYIYSRGRGRGRGRASYRGTCPLNTNFVFRINYPVLKILLRISTW